MCVYIYIYVCYIIFLHIINILYMEFPKDHPLKEAQAILTFRCNGEGFLEANDLMLHKNHEHMVTMGQPRPTILTRHDKAWAQKNQSFGDSGWSGTKRDC